MVVITGRLDHFFGVRNPTFQTSFEETGYVGYRAWVPFTGFSKAEVETLHKVLVSVRISTFFFFITENTIISEFEK